MKNRFIALFLILTILATLLSSCNLTPTPTPDGDCTEHSDSDGDGRCDVCKTEMSGTPDPDPDPDPEKPGDELPDELVYDTTILIETAADAPVSLSSLTHKYLAGDDSTAVYATVERNRAARAHAKVNVEYIYRKGNFYGSVKNSIRDLACSVTEAGRPDIFHNFTYDIIAAALMDSFANLYTETLHQSAGFVDVENNFSFAKDGGYNPEFNDAQSGYMMEYMRSLSLSDKKIYALASDYTIETVAASLIIPVNEGLLRTVTPSNDPDAYSYDADADGVYELTDLYSLVYSKGWDYSAIASFGAEVESQTGGADQLDGVHGFAVSYEFKAATGLIHSSGASALKRRMVDYLDDEGGFYKDYEYWYPEEPVDDLIEVFDAISALMASDGVSLITQSGYASLTRDAIRLRFSEGSVLFGDMIYLGTLEAPEFKTMIGKEDGGYGIAPIPLVRSGEGDYSTLVYQGGRVCAINQRTNKFAQCTAYLEYQSENSSAVLDAYYEELFSNESASNLEENREMLDFVREHITNNFDYIFEEQTCYDKDPYQKWDHMMYTSRFALNTTDFRAYIYEQVRQDKDSKINELMSKITNDT